MAKKDLISTLSSLDPSAYFVTETAPTLAAEEIEERPQREIKSRRVQIILTPTVYEMAKRKRHELDISLNAYISRLIEEDNKQ